MIEKILEKFIRKRRGKTYSAWQVELTTRCPLRCKMCIRAESDDWQSQEMVLQDFKRLLPYLKDVETVEGDETRLTRWVKLVREVAEKVWL